MPNHVTNELHARESVIDSILVDGNVDFRRIVPMPDGLEVEASGDAIEWAEIATGHLNIGEVLRRDGDPAAAFTGGDYGAAAAILQRSNIIRSLTEGPYPKDFAGEEFESFIQCIRNIRSHGYATWYEWSKDHWGTKWNAYSSKRISPTSVTFQTAWSMPANFMQALSAQNPTEVIRICWADEDWGNNAGEVSFKAGEISSGGRFTNGSPEAREMATRLIGPWEDEE